MLIIETSITAIGLVALYLFMANKKIAHMYIKTFTLILLPAIALLKVFYIVKWQYYVAYIMMALLFLSMSFSYDNKLRLKRMLIGLYTFI